jgi:hypothetical protein
MLFYAQKMPKKDLFAQPVSTVCGPHGAVLTSVPHAQRPEGNLALANARAWFGRVERERVGREAERWGRPHRPKTLAAAGGCGCGLTPRAAA